MGRCQARFYQMKPKFILFDHGPFGSVDCRLHWLLETTNVNYKRISIKCADIIFVQCWWFVIPLILRLHIPINSRYKFLYWRTIAKFSYHFCLHHSNNLYIEILCLSLSLVQISLIGQLHLLSSTVTTLAVPSPSLTATLARNSCIHYFIIHFVYLIFTFNHLQYSYH